MIDRRVNGCASRRTDPPLRCCSANSFRFTEAARNSVDDQIDEWHREHSALDVTLEHEKIIQPVRCWVETLVVGLNLCPFAKRELVKNRVRFAVSEAVTEAQLLGDLQAELELLNRDDGVETTLLIHPRVLQDFYDYNQFLNDADDLLVQLELDGVYQIASFHPDYQFGGTGPEDVENYTNRSPYPILHLIREESLERAIASYPDVERIPEHNIELLQSLGREKLQALLRRCLDDPDRGPDVADGSKGDGQAT